MADRLGVETIDREGRLVVIKFRPTAKVDPIRLVKVVHDWPGATLVPPASLKVDLEAKTQVAKATSMPAVVTTGRTTGSRRGGVGTETAGWWTARATTGEVKPGFTKEEILRKPEADPRADGGMFDRLEGLLEALS
jgi:hypothetical protein